MEACPVIVLIRFEGVTKTLHGSEIGQEKYPVTKNLP